MTVRVSGDRWTTSLRCRLFGHRFRGYGSSLPYGKVQRWTLDGLGRSHCEVVLQCERCRATVPVVRFSAPRGWEDPVSPRLPELETRESQEKMAKTLCMTVEGEIHIPPDDHPRWRYYLPSALAVARLAAAIVRGHEASSGPRRAVAGCRPSGPTVPNTRPAPAGPASGTTGDGEAR